MSSSNNTWWNASDSSSFTVPVPKDRTLETFSEWKSLTSQDSSSSYSNPNISCGASADPGDYWLTVNSSSNTVSPGGTTSYVLTAVPLTFSGTISLKADVSGVPGATASLSPQSIGSSGSSTLTVKTSSSTPAGSYQVTVIANSGSVSHSVTTFLVVN